MVVLAINAFFFSNYVQLKGGPCSRYLQMSLHLSKWLRYFMRSDGAILGMVLRIFLPVIAQGLQVHRPDAANAEKTALHIDAVA